MSHGHDPEAAVASLRGQGVKAIRLLYTDLHGVARGKDIPIGHFVELLEDGVAFCSVIMGTDLRHNPVVGGEQGYVDFAIRPDLDTLRVVPWQPEVAWCLGEAWTLDASAHWPSCPRALLARVVARYADRGLLPVVGPELEWFLCTRDPSAPNGLGRYVDELSRVYTVGAVSDPRQINLRTLLWADELGLKAYAGNHEFMNSQYEINLKHSAALDAADRAFMLKTAVKEIAATEGLLATFMGRPFTDQGGSGFHVHLSVTDDDGCERVRRGGRAAEPARSQLRRGSDRACARASRRSSAPRSTRTSGSCRTASPRRMRTGATTTGPPSAASRTSAGRGRGSRSARVTAPRART